VRWVLWTLVGGGVRAASAGERVQRPVMKKAGCGRIDARPKSCRSALLKRWTLGCLLPCTRRANYTEATLFCGACWLTPSPGPSEL